MLKKDAVRAVSAELAKAREQYPPFHSNHEGWAVIKKEVDELWEIVKQEDPFVLNLKMRKEAIQLAAMALRFLIDRC